MLPWRDDGPMTQQEAVEAAAQRLIKAGMVERYRSAFGASRYLGWPGRSGTLRISDHPGRRGRECGIYARVTFSEQGIVGLTDDRFLDAISAAFGRYMLSAPKSQE